jgi:hypothetical protein
MIQETLQFNKTINLLLGDIPGKKGMVVSHERSGTHFLMNALAMNFGYVAKPWINLDQALGLNFHAPWELGAFFAQTEGKPVLNLVKSHHQFDFFRKFIGDLTNEFHVFYIYRDPRDVMVSFWRLVRSFKWDEGPHEDSASAFMRAAPRGNLLRYQKDQVPTMLHRWAAHVEGWLINPPSTNSTGIIPVRYEDLNLRFAETMEKIGERIGRPISDPVKPEKDVNVVLPGKGQVGGHKEVFCAADQEFVVSTVGDLMNRLGMEV